jgi:hypothetical protein
MHSKFFLILKLIDTVVHSKLFTSEAQVNPFILKFLGSRSTFTATAQVITAMIRVKILLGIWKYSTRIMAVIT